MLHFDAHSSQGQGRCGALPVEAMWSNHSNIVRLVFPFSSRSNGARCSDPKRRGIHSDGVDPENSCFLVIIMGEEKSTLSGKGRSRSNCPSKDLPWNLFWLLLQTSSLSRQTETHYHWNGQK